MIKISFVGDIMFEKQYVAASKKNGKYDFSNLFHYVRALLKRSDYVVANLETVFAGENCKYTRGIYSFNTPDEALNAIADSGINLLCTANNHCLDRGVTGLIRTINMLKSKQLEYTGTYLNPKEKDRSHIVEIKGIKYAFMSYTYGTNTIENKIILSEEELGHINLLNKQGVERLNVIGETNSFVRQVASRISQACFSSENRMRIKKALGLRLNVPIVDDNISIDYNYIEKFKNDVISTKQKADVLFLCLHSGGQFNEEPGTFTKEIVKIALNAGIDYIIGSHPHVVQKFEEQLSKKVFFSLGNFSLSPSSIYVLHELKPEYGIIPHFYFDESTSVLVSITFTIIKMVEDSNHVLSVFPISFLYDIINDSEKEKLLSDIRFIYNRVLSEQRHIGIQEEYKIF